MTACGMSSPCIVNTQSRSRSIDERMSSLWSGPGGQLSASVIGPVPPPCSTVPPLNQGRPACRAAARSSAFGATKSSWWWVTVRPRLGWRLNGKEAAT